MSSVIHYYTVIGHKEKGPLLWSKPMTKEQAFEDARLLLANFTGACETRGMLIWATTRDDLRGIQPAGFPVGTEIKLPS